jgi:hypothetical protein
MMDIEPMPDACLPFDGDEQQIIRFLRGPKVGQDGKIQGSVYNGMTPAEVLAQRDAYNRICGE